MVFTLHRYIFRELFRVFLLTTISLTLMLSLTMMLQPMQNLGINPGQALHLFGYFLPITLTFVLPMAALFASALTYGRFAGDNELDACKASGISLATLIYPGLCLAVAVAITSLILSFYIVPAFVHRTEKAIKANAKQILFRNIQRKGYYEIGDSGLRVYADHADPVNDILTGVIVTKSKNETHEITKLITAKTAKVIIDTKHESNEITIVAQQCYQIDEFGSQTYSSQFSVKDEFPPILSDNIKFQKIDRIKEIQNDMMQFHPVRELALIARAQLAAELLTDQINKKIAKQNDNYFQFANEAKIFMFTAKNCNATSDRKIEMVGPITLYEVNRFQPNKLICTYTSNEGFIKIKDDSLNSRLAIVLKNPRWDLGGGIAGIAPRKAIANLTLPENITAKLKEKTLLKNIDSITKTLQTNPTEDLKTKLKELHRKEWTTGKAVISEVHSRLVFGIGCIAIILISIALGIIFRGGHLLSAFGASAIPAGALIIFIMSGKELTKTKNVAIPEMAGIAVMWSGIVVLSILTLILYRKLTKA